MKRHIVLDKLQHLGARALVRPFHGALAVQLGHIRLDRLQTLRPLQRQSQRLLRRHRTDAMLRHRFGRVVDVARRLRLMLLAVVMMVAMSAIGGAVGRCRCAARIAVKVETLDAAHIGGCLAIALLLVVMVPVAVGDAGGGE